MMSQANEYINGSTMEESLVAALDEHRSPDESFICRCGVAKIVSNDNDGEYTITEQRHDPGGDQWVDAVEPLGYVEAGARDYNDRDTGQADDIVHFWEQRGIGGALEVLIDVGSAGGKVMVSSNDTTADYLKEKLLGDDGTGDNIKITLTEQNNGGDETLKIVIDKDDIPSDGGGIDKFICYRIKIPNGSSSGTYTFSSSDWRGRLLFCWLQSIYSNSESTEQWGGGSTSAMCRFFGGLWAGNGGNDSTLVTSSGGNPSVRIAASTGRLYWSWGANSTGNDLYGVCMVQASVAKTSNDYTA